MVGKYDPFILRINDTVNASYKIMNNYIHVQ